MTHEPEPDRDAIIGAVVRELKRPVPSDPFLGRRVWNEIGGGSPGLSGRRRWLGWALAAGVVGLGLLIGLGRGRNQNAPGVSFALEAPEANRVSVVGDFNNWDPGATPLARVSSQGRWEAVIPLEPGRYEFTFVVDGSRWVADPDRPKALGEDFGHPTSVITVLNRSRS